MDVRFEIVRFSGYISDNTWSCATGLRSLCKADRCTPWGWDKSCCPLRPWACEMSRIRAIRRYFCRTRTLTPCWRFSSHMAELAASEWDELVVVAAEGRDAVLHQWETALEEMGRQEPAQKLPSQRRERREIRNLHLNPNFWNSTKFRCERPIRCCSSVFGVESHELPIHNRYPFPCWDTRPDVDGNTRPRPTRRFLFHQGRQGSLVPNNHETSWSLLSSATPS